MAGTALVAIDRPEVKPKAISPRLRGQLVYFASPTKIEGEYAFEEAELATWLDEGVIRIISPLDTENATEVELSEEQESLLEWLRDNKILRVRLEG